MIGGCATVSPPEKNAIIVMARDIKKGQWLPGMTGNPDQWPVGIADKFGLDGKVVAYITFKWNGISRAGGLRMVEARWFAGDKLVSIEDKAHIFGEPPYNVWFSIQSAALGVGKARIEIYVDGVFVGSRSFEVFETFNAAAYTPISRNLFTSL